MVMKCEHLHCLRAPLESTYRALYRGAGEENRSSGDESARDTKEKQNYTRTRETRKTRDARGLLSFSISQASFAPKDIVI